MASVSWRCDTQLWHIDAVRGPSTPSPSARGPVLHHLAAQEVRLATWAINNHPEGFGRPTGNQDPPFTGRGMKAALQALPEPDQAKPAEPARTAGQADELRRRQAQASSQAATRHDAQAAARHLNAFAARLERADPTKKAVAEEIRTLARGGTPARARAALIQKAIEEARKRHPQPRRRGRGRGPDIDR